MFIFLSAEILKKSAEISFTLVHLKWCIHTSGMFNKLGAKRFRSSSKQTYFIAARTTCLVNKIHQHHATSSLWWKKNKYIKQTTTPLEFIFYAICLCSVMFLTWIPKHVTTSHLRLRSRKCPQYGVYGARVWFGLIGCYLCSNIRFTV